MDKFLNFLEQKMVPIAVKLDSNRYLTAVKDGFFGVMSLLIIGSFFLLFAFLPIPGYSEFMASVFGDNWTFFFLIPYDATMNIMTLYVIISMSISLARTYKLDTMAAIASTLVAFIILTPMIVTKDGASGIPVANLGSSGLFLGMLTAILSVEIVNYVYKKNWTIKMPESVPENVSRSFSSLIPALIVIIVFNFVRLLFSFTEFETFQNFIYHYLQVPLTGLGSTLGSMIIVTIIEQLLWMFGIHGANIVGSVMQPIWLALTAENAEAFKAGLEIPHIINYQFYSNFIELGGSGATLGLALLLLFFAKSKQYKALGKLAIGPGIFNINEPLTFGIPIVLNPLMLVPFILCPIIMVIIAYAAMAIGLVPYTNGTNIPWTTPPIISGFLVSGWRGAVLQVVQIFLSMLIYFPFFKAVDNIALKNETAGENQEK